MTLDPKVREALERCDEARARRTFPDALGMTILARDYETLRETIVMRGKIEDAGDLDFQAGPAPPIVALVAKGEGEPVLSPWDVAGWRRNPSPAPVAPSDFIASQHAEDAEVSKVLRDNFVEIVTDAPSDEKAKGGLTDEQCRDLGISTFAEFQERVLREKIEQQAQEIARLREALRQIALAGMTLPRECGDDEEANRRFHAQQAWQFIGIAANAIADAALGREG